ncbi:MAG: valine--tRNA ligase [Firmicutes bacterium]|nr:valine--tRNA ligase [Bacillota bacterium]
MTPVKLAPVYDPKAVEDKCYRFWLDGNYFRAARDPEKETFTIVIPPPNVTGSLHMGHALDNTIQDILIRWKRMAGYDTLWLPGTDHAGIATQIRVEEHLAQEGLSRHDLGREAFLEKVWEWKEEYHGRIVNQLRKLGVSCDWSRERFTMDEGCSKAVREVFVSLYRKGLICRGDYMINWCPRCNTALSDIEVEHKESPGKLVYIRYPMVERDDYIVVATTRPETMLGDTAVAVHPEDDRYRDYIGEKVILPLMEREIPIIADEYVDPTFGTGAVKITPAHDPNDFAIGQRHNLPAPKVIGDDALMTAEAGRYAGMDRDACRKQVVEELRERGLIDKEEEYSHAVGHCQRCNTVIEPFVSRQWFVKMKPLAEPAIKVVKEGRTRFVPERFTRIYLNWLENVRDWCISRQIWWGHRIPAWYCECGEMIVDYEAPQSCPKCGGGELRQDPDVLDTWFSSALWPFSTLGWPEETPDLKHFFPTDVLVTGYDIIYFWVARMIFMSLEFMGEVPFHDVYIHGLVRDHLGRKMSKSLGNGVDPLEIIDQYGADTLRFTLITGQAPGNDQRFRQENVEASRNFANKIWNASRFVFMNLDNYEYQGLLPEKLSRADRWILHRLNETVAEVGRQLDKYELGEAARCIYDFFWSDYCDWYLEWSKLPLTKGEKAEADRVRSVLLYVLEGTLKLLHPFMPFITEEIWQNLPHTSGALVIASWPEPTEQFQYPEAAAEMELLMGIIKFLRNLRSEVNLPPGQKAKVILNPASEKSCKILNEEIEQLQKMTFAEPLLIEKQKPQKALSALVRDVEAYLPLEGLVDLEAEIKRLEKELTELTKDLERTEGKLANEKFIRKAPADVVEKEKRKQKEFTAHQQKLVSRIQELKKLLTAAN